MRTIPKTMKAGDKILPKKLKLGWLTVKSVEDGNLVFVEETKEFFQAHHIESWITVEAYARYTKPPKTLSYEEEEIQNVLDNDDVTEYRLKINDTKWLNVTREQLIAIQNIFND